MRPITAAEEFSKNADLKRADVEHLRQWMAAQPHLPRGVTDEQLILFLHCSHSHLENCKKYIETYYTIRTNSPEIFGNRDPKGDDVHQALSVFDFYHLPRKGQQETHMMAVRLKDLDTSRFSCAHILKTYFMVQDAYMVETGTVSGYVFLADLKGLSIGHVPRIKISYVKLYSDYIQGAFPGNALAIHILNVNSAVKAVLELLRPFLRTEMKRKLFIHTSTDTLYEHVSRDALPMDYGGSLASIETCHKLTVEQLERCSDWFKEEAAFRVDGSKRPE